MLYLPKQSQRLRHKAQRGVVLVLALFVVTLVAAIAYYMMSRLDKDTRRTSLILENANAELYAKGSMAWAVIQLIENWEQQKPNQLVDRTPIQSPVDTVAGYKVFSIIEDMQGRFNINNLLDATSQEGFKVLLKTVVPDLTTDKMTDITTNIIDWINPAASQSELGKYYAGLSPPYRPPHALMTMSSELQLVKGMTPSIYKRLQPYLIALPQITKINVQTAEAPVLMTLSPVITFEAASSIVRERKEKPIVSPEVFLSLDIIKNANITTASITTVSNYFLVETHVQKGDQDLVIYSLVVRLTDQNKAIINILWESKGIW